MAVFSVNQATRMYEGSYGKSTKNGITTITVGDLEVASFPEKNLMTETSTDTDKMNIKVKPATINVKTSKTGNEYLIRLVVDSGSANSYIKAVPVVAKSDAAATLATDIKAALDKSLDREIEKFCKVTTDGTKVVITPELLHTVGKRFYVPHIVAEAIDLSTVTTSSLEVMDPKDVVAVPVANSGSAKLADLEYFCKGETGDVYRGAAWPNDIPYTGTVDPETKYSVKTVHYYQTCGNEASQKSEQTIVVFDIASM